MHHLQDVLDPVALPKYQDVLFCRAHGHDRLCDGFVCDLGHDCASGCCASFAWLKQEYCQPLIEGACPVPGFTYGLKGDFHHLPPSVVEEVVEEQVVPVEEVMVEGAVAVEPIESMD